MGKYKIKYNYDTGNSFGTECDLEDYLELDFNDLEIAKVNLKRIEEHYVQYRDLQRISYESKTRERIFEENQNKDWFVKEEKPCFYYDDKGKRKFQAIDKSQIEACKLKGLEVGTFIDSSSAENCIILYTDAGKPFQFWCPWCGYFESLNYVEIEEDNSDMKISFK